MRKIIDDALKQLSRVSRDKYLLTGEDWAMEGTLPGCTQCSISAHTIGPRVKSGLWGRVCK